MAKHREPTIEVDGRTIRRIPIRTHHITAQDDIVEVAGKYAGPLVQSPEDVVIVSEKVVAVTQGRAIPEDTIHIGLLAKLLWRFVHKTPAGIGLRSPATMQCAINECGGPRILAAAIVGAATKLIGRRGDFYRIAGVQAATIDAAHTSPMQPDCVILGPKNPEKVASAMAKRLNCKAAIMDCNDIGGSWALGISEGLDKSWIERAMAGNPQGQKDEQTPLVLVRAEP